jgi:hypothetical protein
VLAVVVVVVVVVVSAKKHGPPALLPMEEKMAWQCVVLKVYARMCGVCV